MLRTIQNLISVNIKCDVCGYKSKESEEFMRPSHSYNSFKNGDKVMCYTCYDVMMEQREIEFNRAEKLMQAINTDYLD